MNHVNKNARVTDPTPDPWGIDCCWPGDEETTPIKTGTINNGLAVKKPLFGKHEDIGGREDATVRP